MKFTVDWFSDHIPSWQDKILPRLKSTEKPKYLEVGSYEGMSLCWILDNVPGVDATSIDPHEEGGLTNFVANVDLRARAFHRKSKVVLPELYQQGEMFDVIYIDGSHYSRDVMFDTVLCWELLVKGGILVWDDYGWLIDDDELGRPKPAIDAFLTCYRTEYKVLHIGYQFMVEKVI